MTRHPLLPRARALRQSMTKPEVLLWLALRELRPLGFRFRRQVPLLDYIVDFACFTRRIVIEVDGFQHGFDAHAEKDAVRDARLKAAGFTILRFSNADVLENREGVIATLLARCPAPELCP